MLTVVPGHDLHQTALRLHPGQWLKPSELYPLICGWGEKNIIYSKELM